MRGPSKPGLQLMRLWPGPSIRFAPISTTQWCRYKSTAPNASPPDVSGIVDINAIKAEMLARRPQIHTDMMYPTNSYLLAKALSDFLPAECSARQRIPHENVYREDAHMSKALGSYQHPVLPPGHHLVYFPLHLRGSELCPDGTDPYHSPRGTPFTRRMWAGGSVHGFRDMRLDERLAVCYERIVDVDVRGSAGAEKIFVEVLREYTTHASFKQRFDPESMKLSQNPHGITERRTLVFMRELSDEERQKKLEQGQRNVKAPNNPDYSVTLTPTPTLLFHYSALTYNAHRIHLDRAYCREVEGHRDLLVHGPLSLTMVLSVLQSRLAPCEFIDGIDYRHLAPLYVEQPLRICIARQKPRPGKRQGEDAGDEAARKGEEPVVRSKWDVWVENQDGGLCVKGTAETMKPRMG
ncbi:hypothetical protein GGR51DRAFT_134371 [Nemania sp. FL0031]|nr:hypothetical protein GGR51DRAFT_134371 [Nemania sp. FL0031]